MPSSWAAVQQEIRRLVAEGSHAFAEATVANVNRLIEASTKFRLRPPDGVAEGHLRTFRLSWSSARPAPIEVEVHADCYEFYRFFDGRTDIVAFEAEDDQIPEALSKVLAEAVDQALD